MKIPLKTNLKITVLGKNYYLLLTDFKLKILHSHINEY